MNLEYQPCLEIMVFEGPHEMTEKFIGYYVILNVGQINKRRIA